MHVKQHGIKHDDNWKNVGNYVYVNNIIYMVVPTYIKLGLLGPRFTKIGGKMKSHDDNNTKYKKKGSN
jgi:hypothetical protein